MNDKKYGFVTLATGKDFYYKAALRLLQSYRHQGGKYPFCIICDKENKYTKHFDDVILLENCQFNYKDKFELLHHVPYEKTIFIEPDCLIYKNVDDFWSMFENATPVSAFGFNQGDLGFWFHDKEQVEKKFGIKSIPIFNPGYLYIEKNDVTLNCYHDLLTLSKTLAEDEGFAKEDKIFNGKMLRDDPVFCLAMEKNLCTCAVEQTVGKCMSLPSVIKFNELQPSGGRLHVTYNLNGKTTEINDCYILHFSSRRLKEWLYFQQALAFCCLAKKPFAWCAKLIESKWFGTLIKKTFKIKNEIHSRTK